MKVSLITACYNSAKTIKTVMESVLEQKGVEIEYIVVDGGSSSSLGNSSVHGWLCG